MRKATLFSDVKAGQKFWESEHSYDMAYLTKVGSSLSLSYKSDRCGLVNGIGLDAYFSPFEFNGNTVVWVEITAVPLHTIPTGEQFKFELDGYVYTRLPHNVKTSRLFYLDETGVLQSVKQSTKVYEV